MLDQIDQPARELLLLLAGSVLFAASGVVLGATPVVSAGWGRVKRSLERRPSIARMSGALGLLALPAAAGVLVLSSSIPRGVSDGSALLSASLFAVGIVALVVAQAGERAPPSVVALRTGDTVGPSSATIATFNSSSAAPPSKSRAA